MSGEGKVSKTVADLLEDISGKAKTIRDDAFAAGRYDGYSIGYDTGNQDGFDKGKAEGYDEGKAEGYNEGKTEGYDEGYDEGYTAGKAEGEGNGLDTSDADAKASDILKDKTAYVKGQKVVGNIPSKDAAEHIPGKDDIIIESGYYLSGAQTIKGDADLKPENIKRGVSIFDVEGTYGGEDQMVDQAVPVIEFDVNTGKINASAEQATGYVKGGTATAEPVQLTVQKETVLKPTTSKYIGVDAHTYVNGAIWIDAIPNTYVEEGPIDTRIDEIIAVQLKYLTLPTLTVVFPDLQTEIECKFVEGWDWNTFVSSYYNTNNLFSIGSDGAVLVKDINGYYGDSTKSTTFNDGNANKVYGTWKMQEGYYWA